MKCLHLVSLVICSILLTSLSLSAQRGPRLKLGTEYNRNELPYELKQVKNGPTLLVHRNRHVLQIDHLNQYNEVIKSAYFDFNELFAPYNAGPVGFFYVEGYYYYVAKRSNRKMDKVDYFLYRVNCKTLKMDIKNQLFLEQDRLGSPGGSRFHIAVSPDKKLFAFGYHMLADGQANTTNPDSLRFKYQSMIFDPEWNELSSYKYLFTMPKNHFNWSNWAFILNNNGSLFCSMRKYKSWNPEPYNVSVSYHDNQYYFLPFGSSKMYEVDVLSALRQKDSTIRETSIIQTINTKHKKNLYSVTYSDFNNKICLGFAIVEISDTGNLLVLSINPTPTKHLERLEKTKRMNGYEPLWKYRNGEVALQKWVISDFFKIENNYYLISEYNSNFLKTHKTPADVALFGGTVHIGDLIVYKLDLNFQLESSVHVPKFIDADCEDGSCEDLLGQAGLKGYSLIPQDKGFSIYYWNNSDNAWLLNDLFTEDLRLESTERNSKYLKLYRTIITNESHNPVHTTIPLDEESKFRISVNTCLKNNGKLLFYGSKKDKFKIAELPID